MRSLRRVLCRKLSRKLQALKFAVQEAQQAWQRLASNQAIEGLSSIDYHVVVGHLASLITAAEGLQQKIHSLSTLHSIPSHEATPFRCDHYIRIAAIWQNTLFVMLKQSDCAQANCTVCILPPYCIQARLRKHLNLWNPNHSRALRSQRRIREHAAASRLNVDFIDFSSSVGVKHAKQTMCGELVKQTVQSNAEQIDEAIIDCSAACTRTENAADRSAMVVVARLSRRGRGSFELPLWWFHRWRYRSGCRRRARQISAGMPVLFCLCVCAFVNVLIAFPKRKVGKV
jgi:hypothetical protein